VLHSAETWVNRPHFTRVATVKGLLWSCAPFTMSSAMSAYVAKQEVSSIGRLQALQRWMTPETHKRETGTIGKKAEDRPLILNRTCLGEAL
jgi:hypothetical protein